MILAIKNWDLVQRSSSAHIVLESQRLNCDDLFGAVAEK
jgi:hypothetical protein